MRRHSIAALAMAVAACAPDASAISRAELPIPRAMGYDVPRSGSRFRRGGGRRMGSVPKAKRKWLKRQKQAHRRRGAA